MRTFAVLIILLNLAYFAWNQIRQTEPVGEVRFEQSLFMPAEESLIFLSEHSSIPVPIPERESASTESATQVSTLPAQEAASTLESAQVFQLQPRCYVVAGFDDQNEADTFISAISELGVVGQRDVQQEQISSTWWVHLPPFKSQIEAQRVIDELAAKGIDNFYMRTGELAGGISLGVFSREQAATTAQAELSSRGYKASIKEIPRYVSKAYVLIDASDPLFLETLESTAFLATKTKLEATEKLCETIARQNQFP
jgi:hypothetical protein